MKISARFENFSDNAAENIQFLKQIGVDTVSFSLSPMFGFSGEPPRPYTLDELILNMNTAVDMARKAGLEANETSFDITNAFLGKPEGDREIETATALIKAFGDASVSQIWVRPLGIRQGPMGVPGRYNRGHRGGYLSSAFQCKVDERGT